MMSAYQLLPVFLVGLAGSVHCVGMCGGIVGALSVAGPKGATAPRNVIPIRPAGRLAVLTGLAGNAGQAAPAPASGAARAARALPRVLAYNTGRIGSYMLAGAMAGGLAGGAQSLAGLAGLQLGFYWLANLMLIALGLYLMNAWHGLAALEQAGRVLWQRAQPWMAPAMKTLMPAERPRQALALGALWGWLPCGMVYSVLLTAMLSGDALDGALVMLAFGLGTLPMLTGLGLLGARLRLAMQQPKVRIACGLLVLAFGALGIVRAAGGITPAWMDILCLTPHS
jgi:sulfite exporter TauE/SafE